MHDELMQGQLGLLLNPHHLLQSYMVWVDCPAVYANKQFTSLSGKLDHNHLAPDSGTRLLRNVTMWLSI